MTRKNQSPLNERQDPLVFETMLTEISAHFVNLPADQVDNEIKVAQGRVCEFLGLDLSALWQQSAKTPGSLTLTHLYRPLGGPPTPEIMDAQEHFPWSLKQLMAGKVVALSSLEELPVEASRDREAFRYYGIKTSLTFPLSVGGRAPFGFLSFNTMLAERAWSDEIVKRLQLVAQVFANAIARKRYDETLRKAYEEIEQLKEKLEAENIYLRREVYAENIYEHIIGHSESLGQVLQRVEQVAPTDAIVLLTGETGTGKELIAEAIHHLSKRKDRLLVKVNCASLPAALVENELFGREKGAYTGALSRQIGRFELANHSTLFLDEITELPRDVQAKLLRVLQNGEFERLGSPRTIRVDVRLIAATNRDMAAEVQRGAFRKDLYYRLNVFSIDVPPLRERPEDIPLLVHAFIMEFSEKIGKKIQTLSQKSMNALQRYQWPGNIRELRNVIEHAVIVSSGNTLNVQVPPESGGASPQALTMEEAEYQHIMETLRTTGWRIKGPRGAAKLLGMKPSTLYAKMQRLGIPTRTEKDRGMT